MSSVRIVLFQVMQDNCDKGQMLSFLFNTSVFKKQINKLNKSIISETINSGFFKKRAWKKLIISYHYSDLYF